MKFSDLSKSYAENVVIRRLSGSLENGIHYVRAGNGGGKTTLLELASGVAMPTWGQVTWRGCCIAKAVRRGDIFAAYCPARPSFYEGSTVANALRLYNYAHGLSVPRDPFDLCDPFDLSSVRNTLFGDLSFGWKKRVLIQMVFSGSPEILALDEPSIGLDSGAQDVLRALVASRACIGITLIADHDASAGAPLVGTAHRLILDGTPSDRRTYLLPELL